MRVCLRLPNKRLVSATRQDDPQDARVGGSGHGDEAGGGQNADKSDFHGGFSLFAHGAQLEVTQRGAGTLQLSCDYY